MADIKIIPVFFPTTVAMIDDDVSFLENVVFSLNKEHAVYKTMSDPVKACEFFEKEYNIETTIEQATQASEDELAEKDSLNVNISKLHKEMFNPKRFDRISVMIVDQLMPSMNGIDLCRRLSPVLHANKIKTILLTGTVGAEEAVNLFNEDVIDGFISKNEPDFNTKLNAKIIQLQEQYFKDLLHIVIARLAWQPEYSPYAYLYDAGFAKHFNELCKQYNISEHYVYDGGKSLLLVSFEGKVSLMHVLNEEDMKAQKYQMEMQDTQPSDEVKKAIENYEAIVYAGGDTGVLDDPSKWEMGKNVFEAMKVQGESDSFYYLIINNSMVISNQQDGILSFRKYYESIYKQVNSK